MKEALSDGKCRCFGKKNNRPAFGRRWCVLRRAELSKEKGHNCEWCRFWKKMDQTCELFPSSQGI